MATTPRYPPADVTMYLFVATSLEDAVTAKSLLKRKLQPFPGTAAVVGFLDRTGLFVDIWQVEASDVSRVLEELPR